MNVNYAVENVERKGLGIICKEHVKEGGVVYNLYRDTQKVEVEDTVLEDYLKTVPDVMDVLNHGFCVGNKFYDLSQCDSRFTNHSFNPNARFFPELKQSLATRDIQPGEEITENYWDYSLPNNYDHMMKLTLNGNFRDQSKNWV